MKKKRSSFEHIYTHQCNLFTSISIFSVRNTNFKPKKKKCNQMKIASFLFLIFVIGVVVLISNFFLSLYSEKRNQFMLPLKFILVFVFRPLQFCSVSFVNWLVNQNKTTLFHFIYFPFVEFIRMVIFLNVVFNTFNLLYKRIHPTLLMLLLSFL